MKIYVYYTHCRVYNFYTNDYMYFILSVFYKLTNNYLIYPTDDNFAEYNKKFCSTLTLFLDTR